MCLNDTMIKLVESLVRLLPSATEEGGHERAPTPSADGADEPSASTKSGYCLSTSSSSSSSELGLAASPGLQGLERDKECGVRKEPYHRTKAGTEERRDGSRRQRRPRKGTPEMGVMGYKEDNGLERKEAGSKNDALPSHPNTATAHVEFWDKLR